MKTILLRQAMKYLPILALTTITIPMCSLAAAPMQQPTMTLKVGQISNSIAFFPIFVAKQQGYFAQHGLHVGDIPLLGTGAKLAAALESGSIDVAGGNGTDPLNLYRVDKSTQMIAQLINTYYVDIVTGPSFSGPPVSASLDTRIRSLKGKKIGITGPGSGTQALVDFLLRRVKLNGRTDVTLVSLGSNMTGALGALETKRVDALSFPQPVGEQAEASKIGSIYISPARGDIPELKHVVHGVVFTTGKQMRTKGAEIKAFVSGIADAERFIHTARDSQVEQLFHQYRPTMSDATISRLLPTLRSEVPENPAIGEVEFNGEVKFNLVSGLIPSAPSYSEMVPSKFIEAAIQGGSK